jgi:hypothetical protein
VQGWPEFKPTPRKRTVGESGILIIVYFLKIPMFAKVAGG